MGELAGDNQAVYGGLGGGREGGREGRVNRPGGGVPLEMAPRFTGRQ